MDKLNQDARDRLHFLWFITVVVCVMITYYYQKSKAIDNYQKVLQVAAKNCGLEEVKFLVEDIVPDLDGIALHHAAGEGCLKVVKFLIDKGVNINFTRYETALHRASKGGHLEIVKFLLEKGANPHIENNDRRPPRNEVARRLRHLDKDKPYDKIISLLYDAEKRYESKQ